VKLGRRELILSLAALAAAVVYNIWVFTRRADTVIARQQAAVDVAPLENRGGPPNAGPAGAPAVDPMQVPPLPDIGLDRLPEWPRDPFANLRAAPPVVEAADETPAPAPEADPVVASILYSADRRFAMINGRITRVGDEVGGAVVVDIQPNAVVIESPLRGRRTLPLRTPRTVVEPR
jgi:hypothetical protein